MTFFFDHNMPPAVAEALGCLGISAVALRDEFLPNTADEEWMPAVGKLGYVIVTRDRNIHKRVAQRQLYKQLNLKGLFLGPAFAKMKLRDLAKWLLWRWEDIEETMAAAKPGEAFLLQQRGRFQKL